MDLDQLSDDLDEYWSELKVAVIKNSLKTNQTLILTSAPLILVVSCISHFIQDNQLGNMIELIMYKVKRIGSITYNQQQILGKGAQGTIYKGYHQKFKKNVAVKRVPIELKPNIQKNEIQILQSIDKHPNIITLYCTMTSSNNYYIVYQLCKGNLRQTMNSQKLSLEESLKIFAMIVNGCAQLQKKNYIHRDLKPQNILVSQQDFIKLADFGLNIQHSVKGTPIYMAPQMIQCKKQKISIRSDVWSVGVILYQLLFCQKPFKEVKNYMQLKKKITNRVIQFPQLPKIPIQILEMLKSMLRFNQKQRPLFSQIQKQQIIKKHQPKMIPFKFISTTHQKEETFFQTQSKSKFFLKLLNMKDAKYLITKINQIKNHQSLKPVKILTITLIWVIASLKEEDFKLLDNQKQKQKHKIQIQSLQKYYNVIISSFKTQLNMHKKVFKSKANSIFDQNQNIIYKGNLHILLIQVLILINQKISLQYISLLFLLCQIPLKIQIQKKIQELLDELKKNKYQDLRAMLQKLTQQLKQKNI